MDAPISARYASTYDYVLRRRLTAAHSESFPIAGDVFFSPDGKGLIYLVLQTSGETIRTGRRSSEGSPVLQLEVGYLGDDSEIQCLHSFAALVVEAAAKQDKIIQWKSVERTNAQFRELAQSQESKFVGGNTVTNSEVQLAAMLEDQPIRELAVSVRRAGAMLAPDLHKKLPKTGNAAGAVDRLVQAQLLTQELVIICSQTSNQINRVRSRDAIRVTTEAGVLCSCGKPLSEERIEELFSPTDQLKRMLDQSYWTTARLVHALRELGISDERILLNLREGAEEIDAFVDVDGTLLMFELKDSEFSMGHAYPFGGRIGLYKPDYAIIVTTKGVAPEVQQYFKRVKPEAQIVCVNHPSDLTSSLGRVVQEIRSTRARQILSAFDGMGTVGIPLSSMLAPRIGLQLPPPKRDEELSFWA